jgi:hypothetical protein
MLPSSQMRRDAFYSECSELRLRHEHHHLITMMSPESFRLLITDRGWLLRTSHLMQAQVSMVKLREQLHLAVLPAIRAVSKAFQTFKEVFSGNLNR